MADEADSLPVKAGSDDGSVEMIIGQERGKVVQRFQRPMLYVTYEPENAVGVAKTIIDTAVALGANVMIQTPRRKITREQRQRLVVRATHVFRSMQEKGKTPAWIARNVVDTILSAID